MSDPLLNQKFAYFEIQDRIKAGGMSIVYRAYDTRRRLIVALKVLQQSLSLHDDIVTRFEREAKIAERLRHPHIVQFFEADQHQGWLYIAMQFMVGGSLADQLAANPKITLARTADILEQIGSALDYAHHEKVIHRDLKLGNILLDENGDVLLTDFGIARMLDATQGLTTPDQQMPGTVKYMSPEQVMGKTDLDYRSDLYSFTVIAYLLATGRYPFTGTDDIVVINQHLNMQPPAPSRVNPHLPSGLDDVLIKGLAKKPHQRYQSAGEFARAFRDAISGYEAVTAYVDMRAENPALQAQSPDFTRYENQTDHPTIPERATTEPKRIRIDPLMAIIGVIALILGVSVLLAFQTNRIQQDNQQTQSAFSALQATETAFALLPTVTYTPSLTLFPTETETFTPTPSPTHTITPSPTETSLPTSTSTLAMTVTETPLPVTPAEVTDTAFSTVSEFMTALRNLGSQSAFNCVAFIDYYAYLTGESPLAALTVLVDDQDDAFHDVYTFCEDERENPRAPLGFELFFRFDEASRQLDESR
ncbi:MAG: protein kinase [Anaerolineae bacterium]|jgi:serine/threonine protein kinase|nr:protein kinase [Anaerolineae bacterium]